MHALLGLTTDMAILIEPSAQATVCASLAMAPQQEQAPAGFAQPGHSPEEAVWRTAGHVRLVTHPEKVHGMPQSASVWSRHAPLAR